MSLSWASYLRHLVLYAQRRVAILSAHVLWQDSPYHLRFFLFFFLSFFLLQGHVLFLVSHAFALAAVQVAIACRSSSKLCPTVGASGFICGPTLLALVPQQIAEGRKLTSVAAMIPALRLLPAAHHIDFIRCGLKRLRNCRKIRWNGSYRRHVLRS